MTVLAHTYVPRGAAQDIFSCRDPEVLVSGPAGTGKSRACMEKVHLMALLNPGMRALMVRKTQVSFTSSGLVTWRNDVIPETVEGGVVTFYGGSPVEPAQYRYANGSVVVIGGLDKASKIMSTEYDLVYVQEATELTTDDWEALTTRLRNGKVSFQQLLADCNPDAATHWLHQRCVNGRTTMLESRHTDNPRLYDDDGVLTEYGSAYIGKLDSLTGVRYQRLRRGLWVTAEGSIYEDWDPTVHVVASFEIPSHWRRIISVDFGYTNPACIQWWALDEDDRMFCYREVYRTQTLVDDLATEMAGHMKGEPKPKMLVCDHDAEGRAQLTKKLGMGTTAAVKKVTEGIQAVQVRLRAAGDGRPRLFFLDDASMVRDPDLVDASKPTGTVEEIPGYVWDSSARTGVKETPVKADDHGCDAMRYAVMAIDTKKTHNVRWM